MARRGSDDFAAFAEYACRHFDNTIGPQFEPSRTKLSDESACRTAHAIELRFLASVVNTDPR